MVGEAHAVAHRILGINESIIDIWSIELNQGRGNQVQGIWRNDR